MSVLSDFDLMVLKAAAGQNVPGLSWGAAMSVTVESLAGRGLLTRGPEYRITATGLASLKQADPKDVEDANLP